MPVRDYITEDITIDSASKQTDRWKIYANIPSMGSQHPIGPIWKDILEGEDFRGGDRLRVSLVRGKVKKAGSYEEKEYGYFWEIAPDGWDTTAAPTLAPAASSGGYKTAAEMSDQEIYDTANSLQTRIAWNSAVNNAVHLHGPVNEEIQHPNLTFIQETARDIYYFINAGPPASEPAPEWRDPRDGPDAFALTDEPTVHQPAQLGVDFAKPNAERQARKVQTASETPVQRPEPVAASKLEHKPARASKAKLTQLNQSRLDAEGAEVITIDVLENYVSDHYGERGVRQLQDAEIDAVIEDILEGKLGVPAPEPDEVDALPFG